MERNALELTPGDEQLLTLVGLLFESATGIAEVLDGRLATASGLTGQLFEPLLRLTRSAGGRLRMSDLAAQCRYTPSAVTRTADRLVALGFAERISCPSDRRVVYLAVTEAGADAVQASLPDQVDAIRTAVFSEFDADEIDVLDRLLHKVRDTVHPCATASTPLETVAV